ncbi:MAG: class I SAM-dependent methyltransferase [Gluconacetobacter diazotrophicus]|nr:class I SAM-dependent methyltransferase [Gluconacetobacter diazotrophicus]
MADPGPASGAPPAPGDPADRSLAAQYEDYPYPARDPADEKRRLLVGSPSHLREIDHWVFGAARSASTPLRVLVAGCGTGDAAIMLATQLARAGRPGAVIALDRSDKALAVVRARARARNLDNLRCCRGSLLDLPAEAAGPFDYVDCCGVLHHLPDPAAGLRALEAVLAPGGGMGLMVYAPHGRTGVYMLQDALALLAPPAEPPPARLDVAKRVMRHLPATAWLRANINFGDHIEGGDAGLYDLLLNPRDRAYTIDRFLALLDAAGLEAAALMEPARYDPALLLPDPRLRERAASLSPVDRAVLAESLAGNMNTHVLYAVRRGARPPEPDPMREDAVPVPRERPMEAILSRLDGGNTLPLEFGRLLVPLPLPALARPVLTLVDGERPVGAILAALAGRGIDPVRARDAWRGCWDALSRANHLLLRPPP